MSFLETPDDAPLYGPDRERQGYVANYTKVFALRPEVYAAWEVLAKTVKHNMDLHRYELVTLAAARRLRSSYCALAHGSVLRDRFHDAETVARIASDHHDAGLSCTDVAVMDFTEKVVSGATNVTLDDVETLRGHGLSDTDIFDVVLAAGIRCFFSTVLDAVGTRPDESYATTVEPQLRRALTVGRPISE